MYHNLSEDEAERVNMMIKTFLLSSPQTVFKVIGWSTSLYTIGFIVKSLLTLKIHESL